MMLLSSLPFQSFPNSSHKDTLKKSHANSSFKKPKKLSSENPDITFLQEKQQELLRELHQEIQALKSENCELKFQLYAVLQQSNCQNNETKLIQGHDVGNDFVRNNQSLTDTDTTDEANVALCLQAPKSVEHCLKEIREPKVLNHTPIIEQRQIKKTRASVPNTTTEKKIQMGISAHRQASSPAFLNHMHGQGSRKSSLSILPSNYKETVATLPPIILTRSQDIFPSTEMHKNRSTKRWSTHQPTPNFNPTSITKRTSATFEKSTEVVAETNSNNNVKPNCVSTILLKTNGKEE